jgi:hypothetical protein
MNNNKTQCQPVTGYENEYLISSTGEVKSIAKTHLKGGKKCRVPERTISTRIDKFTGYPSVKLVKNGKSCTHHIHRLLAEAFLPRIAGKDIVNHINGDKLDHSLDNLEWCTYSENMKHAIKLGLCKVLTNAKHVVDTCSGQQFNSILEAARASNIHYKRVQRMLYGKITNDTCLQLAA